MLRSGGKDLETEPDWDVQTTPAIPRQVREGLLLLLRAHDYAEDFSCDIWDFAVGIRDLRQVGLTSPDFRWLMHKGYVEHARESTSPGSPKRKFQDKGGLRFRKRSCFALTETGICAAKELRQDIGGTDHGRPNEFPVEPRSRGSQLVKDENGRSEQCPVPCQVPAWDGDRQELRLGDVVVKAYKLPSPHQEQILAAFEKAGWPPRIDDPLPPEPETVAKRRLNDAIESLNRNQKGRLIHFMADGSGDGILWELSPDAGER